jgi:hypothetical protein
MNVDLSDPAAAYLLDRLIEYIQGEEFSPRNAVKSEIISDLIRSKRPTVPTSLLSEKGASGGESA